MDNTGYRSKLISRKYKIHYTQIHYMYSLYKKYGPDILKHKYTAWTNQQKTKAVKRVLNGESIREVALDIGLSETTTLSRWLKEYKEKMYTIDSKHGEKPMNKSSPKKKYMTRDEELKELRKRNLELEIENQYLKKLDALVQKRKAQQQKRKSK